MKKVIKVGFPIVCVVIIGGTFYMLGNLDKKVEDSLRMQQSNSVNKVEETKNEVGTDENIVQEDVTYTVPVNTDNEETSTSDENLKNTENVTEDDENDNTSNITENEDNENVLNDINE